MNLEDFVKTLLYNRDIENKKLDSYDSFVRENGENPLADYTDTVKDAVERYERSLSGYGSSGEALQRSNLAGSGYASHLDEMAKARLSDTVAAAAESKTEAENQLKSDYADFLAGEKEDSEALLSTVLNKVSDINSVSYDAAFDYAVMRGLDEEHADIVAKAAENLWKNDKKQSVIQEITSYGLDYNGARDYALAYGFTEEEALAIAAAAEAVRKSAEDRDFNIYG